MTIRQRNLQRPQKRIMKRSRVTTTHNIFISFLLLLVSSISITTATSSSSSISISTLGGSVTNRRKLAKHHTATTTTAEEELTFFTTSQEDEDDEDDLDDDNEDEDDENEVHYYHDGASITKKKKHRCVALTECQLCPHGGGGGSGLQDNENDDEACGKTGRHQLFECVVQRQRHDGKEKRIDVYESCLRTASDEQFLLLRMQIFCIILGTFSLMTVKKQKIKNASLFDKRRQRNNNTNNSNGTAMTVGGGDNNGSGSNGSPNKVKYTTLKSSDNSMVAIIGSAGDGSGSGDVV